MKLLYMSFIVFLPFLATSGLASADAEDRKVAAIAEVLDAFHNAAATAHWTAYFDLMSDDAVFIGTDASERWTKKVFQKYASTRNGWIYTPKTRHINLTPSGESAWFDEILISKNYGTSRGTGVLILTATGWKISQYALTFPIPNDLATTMTNEIKRYESESDPKP